MKIRKQEDEKPVSPAYDQTQSAARTVIVVVGALTAIVGFVATRDLAGFIAYVKTTDGLSFIALGVSGATFAWGQWKTRKRAKQVKDNQLP